MFSTYKVRIYPTKQQHLRLEDMRKHCCHLYNMCLEERLNYFKYATRNNEIAQFDLSLQKIKTSFSDIDQRKSFTIGRKIIPYYQNYPRRMQNWVIRLVDNAYKGMFTRHKQGKTLGKPQFKSALYWNTIGFDSPIDIKQTNRGFVWKCAFGGTLRIKSDREFPSWSNCKFLSLTKEDKRWFANITYEIPDVEIKEKPKNVIGLDVGIKNAIVTSASDVISIETNKERKNEIGVISRALSRCKRWSKRRLKIKNRLRRLHTRIRGHREAQLHNISRNMTRHYDGIAVENLNLKGLIEITYSKNMRKTWTEHAPGKLFDMIEWKAKRDGRQFKRVNPKNTSQECSNCREIVKKDLSIRIHECFNCGLKTDRDLNASIGIRNRAGWSPKGANLSKSRGCLGNTSLATVHGINIPNESSILTFIPYEHVTKNSVRFSHQGNLFENNGFQSEGFELGRGKGGSITTTGFPRVQG